MHGEAVAIGMVQISRAAEKQGLMPAGMTEKIIAMCENSACRLHTSLGM